MNILIGLIIVLLFSTVINRRKIKKEKEKFNYPGKLIEIDGHKMHIAGSGTGIPTVVMTCGNGAPCAYTEFFPIESKISQTTRTCIYERPGYGWSEFTSNTRDTEQIVYDLKRLLEKAGEKPPYLFVAHSMGAMEAILYTHKYPQEVIGIILIDGTSPYKHIHHSKVSIPNIGVQVFRFLNYTGFIRLAGELKLIPLINQRIKQLPDNIGKIDKEMIYRNFLNDMVIKEGESLKSIALKMNNQIDIKNKPLILFIADSSLKKLPGWRESQNNLLGLSKNSKEIIIKASHITILHEHCDEIVESINGQIYKYREENIISNK